MRKQFQIILDADDVLFDCNGTAVRDLNRSFGTNFKVSDITRWGPMGNALDERLNFFNEPSWVRKLPLFPGAREFVKKLSEIAELLVVTNVPAKCAGARMDALIENFPWIQPSNILIGGRKDLLKADMMLDDAPHNLEKATDVEYPVLFRQPWNYGKTGLYSVSRYDEFLTLVQMVQNGMGIKKPDKYDSIVLVGPSGSGKKKLADNLLKRNPRIRRVTTYTTKPGGMGYIHLSEKKFATKADEFFETSCYMGHRFGTYKPDIAAEIAEGNIPLLIMDINGMVAMKSEFCPISVYVDAPREDCIRDILSRDLSVNEMVRRIASLDLEARNERFCDITLTADSEVSL
ncbi:hypothetical protein LKD70_14230 [Ruminococcus sp. CLA-AA-H200]|uniref:Guanylate kinase-like domain-containing protein n=1 Tax=Ruminococcus turbiniformis TaxID=2881258 RepID=A0ABS8FZQ7_9FIRM|nr:hypothetical protein [Ruminococcus turbiniformis]MCC2255558.1 hypothetical protein [Ruminococcus turbiniformis]